MSHSFTSNVYGGKAAKIGVAADLTASAAGLPVPGVKAWKMTLSGEHIPGIDSRNRFQESIIPGIDNGLWP